MAKSAQLPWQMVKKDDQENEWKLVKWKVTIYILFGLSNKQMTTQKVYKLWFFFLDQFSFTFFWQGFIRSNKTKLTKQQLSYVSRQNLIKKEMTMLLKNNQKVASQQSKKNQQKTIEYPLWMIDPIKQNWPKNI